MSPAEMRLIESRARLRQWSGLKPDASVPRRDGGTGKSGAAAQRSAQGERTSAAGGTRTPGAGQADAASSASPRSETSPSTLASTLFEALRAWWSVQPLSGTLRLANDVAREAVAPYARRHPLALVGGAVVAGALIGVLRPWRLLRSSSPSAPLVPRMVSQFVSQMPLQSLLAVMSAFLVAQAAADEPSADRDHFDAGRDGAHRDRDGVADATDDQPSFNPEPAGPARSAAAEARVEQEKTLRDAPLRAQA